MPCGDVGPPNPSSTVLPRWGVNANASSPPLLQHSASLLQGLGKFSDRLLFMTGFGDKEAVSAEVMDQPSGTFKPFPASGARRTGLEGGRGPKIGVLEGGPGLLASAPGVKMGFWIDGVEAKTGWESRVGERAGGRPGGGPIQSMGVWEKVIARDRTRARSEFSSNSTLDISSILWSGMVLMLQLSSPLTEVGSGEAALSTHAWTSGFSTSSAIVSLAISAALSAINSALAPLAENLPPERRERFTQGAAEESIVSDVARLL